MKKTAVITGITGQDGSWLAKFLLYKNYDVVGLMRRSSHPNLDFIAEMGIRSVILEEADLTDSFSLYHIISKYKPSEFYNLAAMSHVGTSFDQPLITADVTGVGTLRILELLRLYSPNTKFYQAGSSEEFGDVINVGEKQNEKTELRARSPYGAAKIFAHHITKVYRESYNLFACVGLLYNHESERRSKSFVTRKITDHVAKVLLGKTVKPLELGNIYTYRDFGYAPDYCEAMWLMLQQEKPDDYVIATGKTYLIKDFVTKAFEVANIPIYWEGSGLNEVAKFEKNDNLAVIINPKFYRPAEVEYLCGDATKAREKLGWKPSVNFDELVERMVNYDYTYHKTNNK